MIPDGQTTTRFGFKAVNYLDPTKGNLLDDVTFARAYKLSYDKNSTDATGEVPSNQRGKENTTQPAKTKTNGTVKTVADENVRYGSLANGDFSYPSFSDIQKNEQETHADLRTFLKSDDGTLWRNMSATDLPSTERSGRSPVSTLPGSHGPVPRTVQGSNCSRTATPRTRMRRSSPNRTTPASTRTCPPATAACCTRSGSSTPAANPPMPTGCRSSWDPTRTTRRLWR